MNGMDILLNTWNNMIHTAQKPYIIFLCFSALIIKVTFQILRSESPVTGSLLLFRD